MIKQAFDFFLSLVFLGLFLVPGILLFFILFIFQGRPVIHWSKRIGQNSEAFLMPKFRTMSKDVPDVATELLDSPEDWLTPLGSFLRRTSIDEVPQFWSVIKGQMSIVGPRPALHNQKALILMRKEYGIDALKPGITGLAQVNGRDKLSIKEKVA